MPGVVLGYIVRTVMNVKSCLPQSSLTRSILLFMFLVYCMFCLATIVFNTRVNVYSQGNRKCSFLPGCACLYLY